MYLVETNQEVEVLAMIRDLCWVASIDDRKLQWVSRDQLNEGVRN